MKVVVLCGGLGTRLREETEFRPKPMVEIGGRPILWHIMKMYAHYGIREFVLCLGYRGNMIKDYCLNYEAMNSDFKICLGRKSHVQFMGAHEEQDFAVTLADTGLDTMTGGRLQRVARYLENDDTFLLTYGDGLSTSISVVCSTFIASMAASQPSPRFRPSPASECSKLTLRAGSSALWRSPRPTA